MRSGSRARASLPEVEDLGQALDRPVACDGNWLTVSSEVSREATDRAVIKPTPIARAAGESPARYARFGGA